MEFTRKEQKADVQIKVKDIQLSKLHEQIKIRDEMLDNARRTMDHEGVEYELEDPRILTLQELLSDSSSFPPIA